MFQFLLPSFQIVLFCVCLGRDPHGINMSVVNKETNGTCTSGEIHLLGNYSCSYYVHPPGGWIYYFCFFRRPMSDVRCPMSGVRRPMSGVTHGFRSFKGKVLELLSPNLVCRLIGSVACLGLLLAVVPLLLTE